MPLIGTLTSGVSALRTFSKGLEVIGGNIANVNTTGYKSASTSFADTFSNTVGTASGAAQIGSGVQLGGITTDFTQGNLVSTGKTTDLAISGEGYFVVQDGSGASATEFATRDGAFHFTSTGALVNAQGKAVLSGPHAAVAAVVAVPDNPATPLVNEAVTGVPAIPAGPTPIVIPNWDKVSSYSIGLDGTITVNYSDPTLVQQTTFKVGLVKVADQSKLVKQGNNLFDLKSAGLGVTNIVNPKSAGVGSIQSNALEMSNVDLTSQFADLITTQRSFQAGSRLVTVSDSVLEDIVNLKRS